MFIRKTLVGILVALGLVSSCDDEPQQPQQTDYYAEIAERFDCPVSREFVDEWIKLYSGTIPHQIENDLILSGRDGNDVVIPSGSYLFNTNINSAFNLINYSDIENGNIGRCRPADIVCLSDEMSGNNYWEMTWGGVSPSPEMCDENDWDCDGNPNNSFEIYREFECLPEMDLGTFNPDTLVYNNGEDGDKLSICTMGTRHCEGLGWSECAEAVGPDWTTHAMD